MPESVEKRVGLALGSGSARGWAHLGVLKALEEHGIQPEFVCAPNQTLEILHSGYNLRVPDYVTGRCSQTTEACFVAARTKYDVTKVNQSAALN